MSLYLPIVWDTRVREMYGLKYRKKKKQTRLPSHIWLYYLACAAEFTSNPLPDTVHRTVVSQKLALFADPKQSS